MCHGAQIQPLRTHSSQRQRCRTNQRSPCPHIRKYNEHRRRYPGRDKRVEWQPQPRLSPVRFPQTSATAHFHRNRLPPGTYRSNRVLDYWRRYHSGRAHQYHHQHPIPGFAQHQRNSPCRQPPHRYHRKNERFRCCLTR